MTLNTRPQKSPQTPPPHTHTQHNASQPKVEGLPNDLLASASGAATAAQIQQAASGTSSAGAATTVGALGTRLTAGTTGMLPVTTSAGEHNERV